MAKHMIHSLGRSNSFGKLSLLAKILWPMIVSSCDDQGRFDADPDVVTWSICPNVREIEAEKVPELLGEMVKEGMLLLYGDAESFGQILNWWPHQPMSYARPSKYPRPDGWIDRIRYRSGEHWTVINWDHPGGFKEAMNSPAEGIGEGIPKGYGKGFGQGKVIEGKVIEGKVIEGNTTGRPFSQIFTEVTDILVATGVQAEEIDAWMEDVPENWFRDACKEAVDNNARKWAYVRAILERWSKEGKQKRGSYKRSQTTDDLPYDDWLKEQEAARKAQA